MGPDLRHRGQRMRDPLRRAALRQAPSERGRHTKASIGGFQQLSAVIRARVRLFERRDKRSS